MELALDITDCGTWIERVWTYSFKITGLVILSFSILSRLNPPLFEKASKKKLMCNAYELGKYTKNSYASSDNRSSCLFDLNHSDVWEPYPTNILNEIRYFISFIDYFSHVI
jgi:hypothetical protein